MKAEPVWSYPIVAVEPAPAKQSSASKKVRFVASAVAPDQIRAVAPALLPNFCNMVDRKAGIDQVAFLTNPANYALIRRVIVDEYAGATSVITVGPVVVAGTGESVYYVSGDAANEARHYFLASMPGRNCDFDATLFFVGDQLSAREIPSVFAIGHTGNAKVFTIRADMAHFLWTRYAPFSERALRMPPARATKQGNNSLLNAGLIYTHSRAFPDSPLTPTINRLLARGFKRCELTGFVRLCIAATALPKHVAAVLAPQIEAAERMNAIIDLEKCATPPKTLYTDRFARINVTGNVTALEKMPCDADELRACTIVSSKGRLLSLPFFADNEYIRFSVRERPQTEYGYKTIEIEAESEAESEAGSEAESEAEGEAESTRAVKKIKREVKSE